MQTGIKKVKVIGDPNGTQKQRARFTKCQRSKNRNQMRREWRAANPAMRGRQLHCWPLPQ